MGAYFPDGKFSCNISFFVYTFCRLLDFNQKLNMTYQNFHKYSLVIMLQQNYSNVAYFGNYQRISVSIESSAKCSYFLPLFDRPKINIVFLYGLNIRTCMATPNHNSNKEQTLCFEMPLLLQISTLLIFSLTNFNYNQ